MSGNTQLPSSRTTLIQVMHSLRQTRWYHFHFRVATAVGILKFRFVSLAIIHDCLRFPLEFYCITISLIFGETNIVVYTIQYTFYRATQIVLTDGRTNRNQMLFLIFLFISIQNELKMPFDYYFVWQNASWAISNEHEKIVFDFGAIGKWRNNNNNDNMPSYLNFQSKKFI